MRLCRVCGWVCVCPLPLGVTAGYSIYVKDVDPANTVGGLQDVSQVEKFTMSEEAYAARDNTFRKQLAAEKEAKARKAEEARLAAEAEPAPSHVKVRPSACWRTPSAGGVDRARTRGLTRLPGLLGCAGGPAVYCPRR